MKPLLRSGSAVFLFLFFFQWPGLIAQLDPLAEKARNIWLQKYPKTFPEKNFQFDRITENGDMVIFEKYNPASFIILMKTSEGNILVGYSLENLFFGDKSGPAHQSEILEAIEKAARHCPRNLKVTNSLANSIGPLIHSHWGQGKFFNYYCPLDSRGPNGRVYVGCVAVAVGQIIKYYGGFNSITLQHDHVSGHYGLLHAQLGPYDWTSMEDKPVSVNLEVSDFLYDLGVLLHMSYGASGSTTNSHRTLEAFHELGYIGGTISRKSKFSAESWLEIFYQNLSEYKPVLVTGGGHAFVCDGYSEDGLFHFNLGWEGYADGYYPLAGVMNMSVNEAFTELEPRSWPEPPKTIELRTWERETFLVWNYDPDQDPILSRIYVDDRLFLETADTAIMISQIIAGRHKVNVSAVYPDGESRWIGPVEVFVRGAPVIIDDPALYSIFRRNLGYGLADTEELLIYEGDLSRIISLEIDRPLKNMEGIGLCGNLQRLIIHSFPGIPLDAGPLRDLTNLRILEWNGRTMIQPETLGKLNQLTELRIRQTHVESLDFLSGFNKLMIFEYSDARVGKADILSSLPLLESLVLRNTGIKQAGFVSGMKQLICLDLSGNLLDETVFLSALANLNRANLSNNHIRKLLLTDQLQSLQKLDISENEISEITITTELNLLYSIDLSGNLLVSPGRLFLLTPALSELDLSKNRLRDMGKQRCPNLEILDVSYNHLISTEWISLQPRLKRLNLEHNRISDLSGLTKNNLFRQLKFLGLEKNPLSKQSFLEWLPVLVSAIEKVSRPDAYQPLSPCYLSPAAGSRVIGSDLELGWVTDAAEHACVYDLLIVSGDSLVPVIQGIDASNVKLTNRPAAVFSWVIASRTADTVFYSGINDVVTTADWPVPFQEGFENYREGESLSEQSEFWFISDGGGESKPSARIVSSNSRTGNKSLELTGDASALLPTGHLERTYLSVQFSLLIPPGNQAEFRLQNLNGIYLRFEWDATDVGRFYVNDKMYNMFKVDHQNWTDFEIMAHARNNSFFVKAGGKMLINESWLVPEGVISAESIGFFSHFNESGTDGADNGLLIDDVLITASIETSGKEIDRFPEKPILVYPNPFVDVIHVKIPNSVRCEIALLDMAGREILRKIIDTTTNPDISIPLPGLVPGLYTLYIPGTSYKPLRIARQ